MKFKDKGLVEETWIITIITKTTRLTYTLSRFSCSFPLNSDPLIWMFNPSYHLPIDIFATEACVKCDRFIARKYPKCRSACVSSRGSGYKKWQKVFCRILHDIYRLNPQGHSAIWSSPAPYIKTAKLLLLGVISRVSNDAPAVCSRSGLRSMKGVKMVSPSAELIDAPGEKN